MLHEGKLKRSRLMICDACGSTISKESISISKTFDGATYHFDSDDCLLIFKKLRVIYGKKFF